MVTCPNCNGTFAEDAVRCPYCGTMHLAAATDAYNEKFEDINEDLEELGDHHFDEYKKEAIAQSKDTLKLFRKVIFILLAITIVGVALSQIPRLFERAQVAETKAKLAWQMETYAELDVLYEAGKYDEIIAFEDELFRDDDNDYSLFSWDKYDFIGLYRSYSEYKAMRARYDAGEKLYNFDYTSLFLFYFSNVPTPNYWNLGEAEITLLTGYTDEVADFLEETLGLTQADLTALRADLADEDDWISYSAVQEYVTDTLNIE